MALPPSSDLGTLFSTGAPPPKSRAAFWVIVVLIVLLGIPLAGLGWLVLEYPHERGPGKGRVVEVTIEPGTDLDGVARQLASGGALRDPGLFVWLARVRGAATRLKQGTILVFDSMTPRQLLQRIARGYGSAELKIVLPEGQTRFDYGHKLARFGVCPYDAFIAATEDAALLQELDVKAATAEGFLFPDTYELHDEMDARQVVRRLVANGKRRTAELFAGQAAQLQRLATDLGFGLNEVITLASIVEKEAAAKREQGMIAGVFLNRLRDPSFKPKRLQADPTVAYGCVVAAPSAPSCAEFDGLHVTHAMVVDAQNPYNTYRLEGLPPSPIANPGISAIAAVLAPTEHEFFYFVAKGGGLHQFSRSLADHNTAVGQQRIR